MVDLEAVGGTATGGLVASTFESPAGKAGEHHPTCADCGTQTLGRFCHNCGNAAHVHRTLLHLGEELLHGVMHFDSRAWRTLPRLVFRPGQLTREWCLGKRARYVSPLAMFLFTVFVLFMAISYLPEAPAMTLAQERAVAAAELSRSRTELAEAEAALAKAANPQDRAEAEGAARAARAGVAAAMDEFRGLETAARVAGGDWKAQLAEETRTGKLKINTGDGKLDEKLRHKLENPELALYKLSQTFYKFSFLLVPISIPFVALLFLWKRGFTLYDHGVFVLYSLTFMSLLIMVVAGALRVGGPAASVAFSAVPFVVPAHMFFQLKGAYGLSVLSALWRTMLLLIFAAVAAGVFLLAILWLGLA
ncbi:MAG: DUF3667 domain-containing protein [Phenylobacterium sp.]|uniref:DUF3667 domain-containing protein n=1 Tax=Phenylobacterium sp. TaxID=1871053 RepID=UPI001A3D61BC|nr:DUF3667 domain-containing protein [Phenylobacterium sp.]MBL8770806.1 DUF3667 domain-containing protein [Phenylobacterium sp.]